jgi:hypothetical protein
MTRKSKREIERAVDDLGDDGDGDDWGTSVVYEDHTGDYYADRDMTEPVEDPDALPGLTVILSGRGGTCIMLREHAEREGREILGPAENTPPGNDAVRVRRE